MSRSSGCLDFRHFLSDARIVALSARTESDNHGAGEDLQTCRDVRGQRESREEDRVERRMAVAELECMSEKESLEGRDDKRRPERRKRYRVC